MEINRFPSASSALTFWDPQMDYGPFYLEDMMNAFKYVDCDYITKAAYYQGNILVTAVEHEYVSVIPIKICATS